MAPHHSHNWDLACASAIWRNLWALVAAALFLAGTLGSSSFVVLYCTLKMQITFLSYAVTAPPGSVPLGIAQLLVRRASVVKQSPGVYKILHMPPVYTII